MLRKGAGMQVGALFLQDVFHKRCLTRLREFVMELVNHDLTQAKFRVLVTNPVIFGGVVTTVKAWSACRPLIAVKNLIGLEGMSATRK